MTESNLPKFMVMFIIPQATMAEWAKTDASVREASEKELMLKWQEWNTAHADMILRSVAAGKTKAVTASGIAEDRNDIIVYSIVQGVSHDAVADIYKDHPHLTIPTASIQVMAVRAM